MGVAAVSNHNFHGSNQRHSYSGPFGQWASDGHLHPLVLARINRAAVHLQALGPRAVAEALTELAKGQHGPAEVLDMLGRYGRISRAQIAAAGGDRPMPRQLVEVPL